MTSSSWSAPACAISLGPRSGVGCGGWSGFRELPILREEILGDERRAVLVRGAIDLRHGDEVAVWRGRRDRPFQPVVLPRILRRLRTLEPAHDEVHREDQLRGEQQECG